MSMNFQIVRYNFISQKVRKPLRIVMIADLHNQVYGLENTDLLTAIDTEQPDIILLPGDMIVCRKSERKNNRVTADTIRNHGYEIRKICSDIRFDISFRTSDTNSHDPASPETRSDTEANPMYGTDSRQHAVTYCFTTIKKIHSTPFSASFETITGAEIIY